MWLSLGEVVPDQVGNLVQFERLGQHAGHPDLLRALGRVVGREDDDRRVRAGPVAIHPREIPAVHERHLHVEQDKVGRPRLDARQGPISRLSNSHSDNWRAL